VTDPEARGQELIEELNNTLNGEFEARADYREAIETAHSFLDGVIAGLDSDDKRDAGGEG
jgi:bacterioferritin (cytochrome b1)